VRTTCVGKRLGLPLLLFLLALRAERLPVRNYTSADGLLIDGAITQTMQDSRGLLWFVSARGLNRFDGRSFRSYGAEEGLEGASQIVETRPGEYWVAARRGIARYRPEAPPGQRFPVEHIAADQNADTVAAIAADGAGGVWLGSEAGLYHGVSSPQGMAFHLALRPETPSGTEPEGRTPILHLLVDSHGVLWATASYCGVYRILTDGSIEHYAARDGLPPLTDGPFLEDRRHRIWLSTPLGLLELDSAARPGRKLVLRTIDTRSGLGERAVYGISETDDGHIWMASHAGLLEYDGARLRRYTRANGLSEDQVWSVAPDRAGNLWVGTGSSGVMRIAREGLTTFDEADGIPSANIRSVISLPPYDLVAITGDLEHFRIHLRDGARFRAIQPQFPNGTRFGWGVSQIVSRTPSGETWVATYDGLARFPPTASIAGLDGLHPSAMYTMRDGLPSNVVHKVFADSRGDVWFGMMLPPRFGFARWNHATGRIEDLSHVVGAPVEHAATAFAETADGSIWIGFLNGDLRRYAGGRFVEVDGGGRVQGSVESLYIDDAQRLWGVSHSGGPFRIDRAGADRPSASWAPGAAGGSGEALMACITGDARGLIYTGASTGLSRFDPAVGAVEHFSVSDGLANNQIDTCGRGPDGQLWFGTHQGLSRFISMPARAGETPDVRLVWAQIGARLLPISDLGASTVSAAPVPAQESSLRVSFAAVDPAGKLTYRYRLEGASILWSRAGPQQTVEYPYLPPGQYRFVAEAVGTGRPRAATLTFEILPPIWRRWWFITLAALTAAAAAYTLYRFRVTQIVAVERVRSRIAGDLHDEIGSALSRIALLSEVAQRHAAAGAAIQDGSAGALERIATVARETGCAMSDIVWTINPQRDSLGDLGVRLRAYATDLLSAREIECTFATPDAQLDLRLPLETRRELLLAAKEAIHNAARHSRARRVKIDLRQEKNAVLFRIEDDGIGFDPNADYAGHGIAGMRSRAARAGGQLRIERLEPGTRVELRFRS
jgi:signal transduction histidine kinase/ligand-binding sensor domain-containing protein